METKEVFLIEGTSSYPKIKFIEVSDIEYDTLQLLKKAQILTNFYSGIDWAKGFNYRITKDAEKNITVIFVYGWEKNHKQMKVLPFNATTGELVRKIQTVIEEYLFSI